MRRKEQGRSTRLWVLLLSVSLQGIAQTTADQYLRALVYPHAGDATSGYITRIDNDTIVLLTTKGPRRIGANDVKRVVVLNERTLSRGFLYGAVLGLTLAPLLGTDLPFTSDAAYLPEDPNLLAFGAVGLLVGSVLGGVGALIDPSNESREFYEFPGNGTANKQGMQRLRERLAGENGIPRVHLSFCGGQVSPMVSDHTNELLAQNGYYFLNRRSNANLLRKVQLTYSLIPSIEIGTAVIWFGEPGIDGDAMFIDTQKLMHFLSIRQSIRSVGYYVVGAYRFGNNRIGGSMGIGIGQARIGYDLDSKIEIYGGPWPVVIDQKYSMSKAELSESVFLNIRYQFHELLSLGLYADYTLANGGKEYIPAIVDAGIPEQSLQFRNGCAGLSMSLHF